MGAMVRPGENVSRGEWERIFGSEAQRRARARQFRRKVLKAGDKASANVAAAVHDDRPWGSKGEYYASLGETVYSRTHEREILKRHGLRHAD